MPSVHLPKKPWVSDDIITRGNKTVQQKKQILVTDLNDKKRKRDVKTSAGVIKFVSGTAILPNDARGRDLVDEYRATSALDPDGVIAVKDREGFYRDPVHRNFWGSMPEMPWKRERNNEGEEDLATEDIELSPEESECE